MQGHPATLYCSNLTCQSPNLETDAYCQHCQTPLLKRYLWLIGTASPPYQIGDWACDRYLFKGDRIVLDTQPYLPPHTTPDVPSGIEHYLRLFPYRLHVPQVYGLLDPQKPHLWLLEEGALCAADLLLNSPELVTRPPREPAISDSPAAFASPQLVNVWQFASALRQLNWLWQIAQLWQPLCTEGVASSLLQPELVRVSGSVIRLLELATDAHPPTLTDLGHTWKTWLTGASPEITPFLGDLCLKLLGNQMTSIEMVIDQIDQQLRLLGQAQVRQFQLVTYSDQGPTRAHNEDACYPESGTFLISPTEAGTSQSCLAIVCDGVGGHDGGDVASNLAVSTIQRQLQSLLLPKQHYLPGALHSILEEAVYAANQILCERNDFEKRQERQRMGTTVVMALVDTHELYITHLGDSRAYLITRTGCSQITLDDDMGTREVRLGYALYRDTLRWSSAGCLIQALGMGSSTMLRPTIQRLILEEDCLILLCSDGLSDNDRVEQYWQTELLPILNGSIALDTAAQRLIEIANTRNGHDNVTVGLIYCQVAPPSSAASEHTLSDATVGVEAESTPTVSSEPLSPPQPTVQVSANPVTANPVTASPVTEEATPSPAITGRNRLPFTLSFLLLLGGGGLLFLLVMMGWTALRLYQGTPTPLASPTPLHTPKSAANPTPKPSPQPSVVKRSQQSSLSTASPSDRSTVTLPENGTLVKLQQPLQALPLESQVKKYRIPARSTLLIHDTKSEGDTTWLELKICQLPPGVKTASLIKPGNFVKIESKNFQPSMFRAGTHLEESSCPF
jgi:serine/threonine protein phosphatase PrpC